MKKEAPADDDDEFEYDTGSEGSGTNYSKSTYSDSLAQQAGTQPPAQPAQFSSQIPNYNFNQSQPINFYHNQPEPGPSVDLQTLEDFVSDL